MVIVFALGKIEMVTGIALAMRMIFFLLLLGMVKMILNQHHVLRSGQTPNVMMTRIGFGN